MKKTLFGLLLLCLPFLWACGDREQFVFEPLSHAELLRTCRGEGWTGVEVLDAWHPGHVLHRYLLVPCGADVPVGLPEGTLVRTPLERAVLFSSVHAALLADLRALNAAGGVCDAAYVLHDTLRRCLADGRLADMGSSVQPDMERLARLRPDALWVSPFENAGYGALETLGVPIIECADYMETSALGRAEWMKFYGMLVGREAEADSLFAEVERSYRELAELAARADRHPSLLCDVKQGSAWYVPAGNSYLGRLFADAGARYLFAGRSGQGSVALSYETVFAEGHDADVWIVKYGRSVPYTYASLVQDFPSYAAFRPWKERRIFGCNTYEIPFYEEVPFHPDRLLRDMVEVLHPGLLPGHALRYYRPLAAGE